MTILPVVVRTPPRSGTVLPAAIGLAIPLVGALWLLTARRTPRTRPTPLPGTAARAVEPSGAEAAPHQVVVTAARRLNRACGVLAFSVLADSGIEHWRGSFHNRAMYTPIAVAGLILGVSLHGTADQRPIAHAVRDTAYALATATALTGGGFHVYNVIKRPGGVSWHNLFYGAPIGAPWALLLAGLLGTYSERVRGAPSGTSPRVFGLPAGRTLAIVASGGLAGTVGEAALLHFRGAFHDPAMFLPVTVPPVAAMLLAGAASGQRHRIHRFTRFWLRMTALLGFAGVAFHTLGIQRNMGGWRNWSQNLLNGPPLPAPPSFTGLALAGLAAIRLMDDRPDA